MLHDGDVCKEEGQVRFDREGKRRQKKGGLSIDMKCQSEGKEQKSLVLFFLTKCLG